MKLILAKKINLFSNIYNMFFKKGHSNGFFKKAVDAGHMGLKVLSHPATFVASNLLAPNSTVAKVSGVLQKIR